MNKVSRLLLRPTDVNFAGHGLCVIYGDVKGRVGPAPKSLRNECAVTSHAEDWPRTGQS